MERMTFKKETLLKPIILNGLEATKYGLIKKTSCAKTPIYLYLNTDNNAIAIYCCGFWNDELILMDGNKKAKVRILIEEFKNHSDSCHMEIASILDKILDESWYKTNSPVTFL